MRNTRVPVRALEVQQAGGWVNVTRQDYHFFVEPWGLGPGPYSLRVTGSDGQQLVETGVELRDFGDVPGTQQFQSPRVTAEPVNCTVRSSVRFVLVANPARA